MRRKGFGPCSPHLHPPACLCDLGFFTPSPKLFTGQHAASLISYSPADGREGEEGYSVLGEGREGERERDGEREREGRGEG